MRDNSSPDDAPAARGRHAAADRPRTGPLRGPGGAYGDAGASARVHRPGDGDRVPAAAVPPAEVPREAPGDGPAPGDSPGDGDDKVRPRRRSKDGKPRSLRRTVLEWAGVIGGGIIIALVIEAFLVQAFWIPSASMSTTLNVGDRVLVNKLSYRLHDVHRGDVIVFERPSNTSPGSEDIKDLIKRVIAVGGDTIEARDQLVYVNDERVDESEYLDSGTPTDNLPRQTIPEGHVFVMGDNRTDSEDSRVFGPIDEDRIVGRAFVRVLPIGDIGFL